MYRVPSIALQAHHFRGIGTLIWSPSSSAICLSTVSWSPTMSVSRAFQDEACGSVRHVIGKPQAHKHAASARILLCGVKATTIQPRAPDAAAFGGRCGVAPTFPSEIWTIGGKTPSALAAPRPPPPPPAGSAVIARRSCFPTPDPPVGSC